MPWELQTIGDGNVGLLASTSQIALGWPAASVQLRVPTWQTPPEVATGRHGTIPALRSNTPSQLLSMPSHASTSGRGRPNRSSSSQSAASLTTAHTTVSGAGVPARAQRAKPSASPSAGPPLSQCRSQS